MSWSITKTIRILMGLPIAIVSEVVVDNLVDNQQLTDVGGVANPNSEVVEKRSQAHQCLANPNDLAAQDHLHIA